MKLFSVLIVSLSTFLPSASVTAQWSVVRPQRTARIDQSHFYTSPLNYRMIPASTSSTILSHQTNSSPPSPSSSSLSSSSSSSLKHSSSSGAQTAPSHFIQKSTSPELLLQLPLDALSSSHLQIEPALSLSNKQTFQESSQVTQQQQHQQQQHLHHHQQQQQQKQKQQQQQQQHTTPTIVIRHPNTCSYDRNQAACTFQLLCYLANGTPVEGCNDSTLFTCCYLRTSEKSIQFQSQSLSQQAPSLVSLFSQQFQQHQQRTDSTGGAAATATATFSIRHDPPLPASSLSQLTLHQSSALSPQSLSSSAAAAAATASSSTSSTSASASPSSSLSSSTSLFHQVPALPNFQQISSQPSLSLPQHLSLQSQKQNTFVSRIPAHYLTPVTSKFRTSYNLATPINNAELDKEDEYNINQPFSIATSATHQQRYSSDILNNIRRSRTDPPTPPSQSSISSSKLHFPMSGSFKKLWAKDYDIDDICGRPMAKPRARIIGGQEAYFGEFPWQVHIKIQKHQCGGALLNNRYIVTAAHCIYQAPMRQLNVIIGAHDIEDARFQDILPQYFSVEKVILHPEFKFSASHPDRYDIALVRLDRQVRFSDSVLPVCLPESSARFEGWTGIVTGWGKTDPASSNRYGTRLLQKVEVPIIDNSKCETWHRTRGIDLTIFNEMMCAGYEEGARDACVGDSGGPLVTPINGRWTLAGITSAGFGCAQSRQPGIYHRVANSVEWIKQTLENEMNSLQVELSSRIWKD